MPIHPSSEFRLAVSPSSISDSWATKTFQYAWLFAFCVAGWARGNEPFSWPSWRGPENTGSISTGKYPTRLDESQFLWKSPLPGKGCSTPIVINQRIYLTGAAAGQDALLCFDMSGAEQWRANFGQENPGKHKNGSGSNASPVTDGQAVFVYFKSGTFAAVNLDGSVRWKTDLVARFGKDTLFWDHGTSPVLTSQFVIMARMHQGESWLAAFDKVTGGLAWKVPRNYKTPVECDHGYSTPVVIQHGGRESILVWGAEHMTIHDATDGSVSWSCGNFNPEQNKLWPSIATPVIVGDMAVIAYGRNDRGIPRLFGIKLSGTGDVTSTNHVWQRTDVGPFATSPLAYQGNVILVSDRGEVECIDPLTGKTLWNGEFPKRKPNFYASPLVAGELLFAPREDGVVFVAQISNNSFQVLSENDMSEPIIGSPVPCGDRLLLRGEKHLFCIAGSK